MISQAQRVPASYYFEGLNLDEEAEPTSKVINLGSLFEDREALRLVAMYRRLTPNCRDSHASIAKTISRSG